jgi:hypothetical protein
MQWGNRGLVTFDQFRGELSMDELVFDGGPHGVATFQIDAADVWLGAGGIRMTPSRPGGEVEIRLLNGSVLDALEAGSNLFAEVAGRLRVQLEEGSMIHVAGNVSDIRQLSEEVQFLPKRASACDFQVRGFVFDYDPASDSTSITSGPVDRLFPGDADRDFDFDQLDLVRVQIAGKYLTGKAATWGEGDWDGAPGGSKGSPPAGNGRFDQIDIVSALAAGKYLTGPYAAVASGGARGDGQTTMIYDPRTGEVAVDAPAATQLTSINIDSAGAIFTGAPAANLGGSFDNDKDNNIFKATFGSSFGSLSFGNVAQAGLSQQFVLSDLTVVGSLAGGGALGSVDLIYVPEPATVVLLLLGLLGLVALARKCEHI